MTLRRLMIVVALAALLCAAAAWFTVHIDGGLPGLWVYLFDPDVGILRR